MHVKSTVLVNVVDVQKMTPTRVVCVQLAMFLVLAASVQLISARYVYNTANLFGIPRKVLR